MTAKRNKKRVTKRRGAVAAFSIVAMVPLLGMTAIGVWSLRRSYGTTMKSIIGLETGSSGPLAARGPASPTRSEENRGQKVGGSMVERTLPLVPDRLAGITLASLRGTLRAPEAIVDAVLEMIQ